MEQPPRHAGCIGDRFGLQVLLVRRDGTIVATESSESKSAQGQKCTYDCSVNTKCLLALRKFSSRVHCVKYRVYTRCNLSSRQLGFFGISIIARTLFPGSPLVE